MNELERVKEKAREVKLSLEALSSTKRDKPAPRPLAELLAEWNGKPLAVSDAFKATLRRPEAAE